MRLPWPSPLDAINKEAAREKSIRRGHPSTLHLWWARRSLAACRAVLFASWVDDPSSHPDRFPTEEAQATERERLFKIIRQMVRWEAVTGKDPVAVRALEQAREEILKATNGNPPPVLDPFCGGGSIPLEAQRLGLDEQDSGEKAKTYPVNPVHPVKNGLWRGAQGLAEDVRYYGKWMRDEVEKRIGHLDPKVKLPKEHGGGEATVIAWLWARTVKCPNPACGATMPLVRSFWLSTKKGQKAWVEPVVRSQDGSPPTNPSRDSDGAGSAVRFEVKTGKGTAPEGTVKNRAARCLVCGDETKLPYIRTEAQAGRMGTMPLAIVAEGERGRLYVAADPEHGRIARSAEPPWKPEEKVTTPSHDVDRLPMHGLPTWGDAFTPRQLVALTTFCDLVGEARDRVLQDALDAGLPDDDVGLSDLPAPSEARQAGGGAGAKAYAEAVGTYLAFAVNKAVDRNTSLCTWESRMDRMRGTFARQALPMVWDFAETNPLAGAAGDIRGTVESLCDVLDVLDPRAAGRLDQLEASACLADASSALVSTDPPYYDNVGYADLSDFFYVWLRRSLGGVHADLFSTLLAPKTRELIASLHRFHGSKAEAEKHFVDGLGEAFRLICARSKPELPTTVFYAFKQQERGDDEASAMASTGWETMLEGLLSVGFQITGTWPMRTELSTRSVGMGTNALASSIVLVCRPCPDDASMATRRELTAAVRRELPDALRKLQQGNIAPVDMAQAAIGPGMAVFSRYSKVLEADGSPLRVRTALQLINQELDACLAEQEGDLDADTRFCVAWFEQYGMGEGAFGEADVLARAKNTAVAGLIQAGVLEAKAGKVRLLRRDEYPDEWDSVEDRRLTVWECAQYLIRALDRGGEQEAARLSNQLGGGRSDDARALAYRLYAICERKGWAQEALAYNTLVASWTEVQGKVASVAIGEQQGRLFE